MIARDVEAHPMARDIEIHIMARVQTGGTKIGTDSVEEF